MRIAVFGAGGAGGYFGARLAAAGEDVAFIARGAHLEALREGGLKLASPLGDLELDGIDATDDPTAVGPVDAVLVGVKSWQLREAALAMGPLLGPDSFVVPMLNGVEATEQLARVLGARRPLKGLVKLFAHIEGPGRIRHVGATPTAVFKEAENTESERATRLREALEGAGVVAPAVDDIDAALWEKFLVVVSVGGVGAVARAPIGIVRELPETRRLLEDSMREVAALAAARRIVLSPEIVERSLEFIDSLPAEGVASLHRDLAAGRRSELDAWSGAVVRLARESGVATPTHDLIYAALLPTELRARGERSFDS